MKVLGGMLLIAAIGIGLWLFIEHVTDKMFDNDDLGDSDYGC
jgi:hypothetical protein